MNTTRMVTFAAVSLLAVGSVVALQGAPQALPAAPTFSAKGSDGRTHTLQSLTARGPVFLYFIKDGCPTNDEALVYYKRLANAYRGKATFIGVIDVDAARFRAWNAEKKLPMTVLFDPQKKIIGSMGVEASPWVIEINRNRRVAKVWPGYSVGEINEISARMAGAARTRVAKIDTTGAPRESRFG
jgi:peroxiredoxin